MRRQCRRLQRSAPCLLLPLQALVRWLIGAAERLSTRVPCLHQGTAAAPRLQPGRHQSPCSVTSQLVSEHSAHTFWPVQQSLSSITGPRMASVRKEFEVATQGCTQLAWLHPADDGCESAWPKSLRSTRTFHHGSSAPQEAPGPYWTGGAPRRGLVLEDCPVSTGIGAVLTGNTQVSAISFGAAPLGGVYGDTSEELCIQAVHEAFKLGAESSPLVVAQTETRNRHCSYRCAFCCLSNHAPK